MINFQTAMRKQQEQLLERLMVRKPSTCNRQRGRNSQHRREWGVAREEHLEIPSQIECSDGRNHPVGEDKIKENFDDKELNPQAQEILQKPSSNLWMMWYVLSKSFHLIWERGRWIFASKSLMECWKIKRAYWKKSSRNGENCLWVTKCY